MTRPKVLIVGAGFAGFHCARELERLLRPSGAELMLASPVAAALGRLRQRGRRSARAPCGPTGGGRTR
ncbi:MAG: hypothetical protein ACRDOL_41550 [Streptosporangiaceae bacterium]